MSFSRYRDRRFEPRQHQYVVSLSKTLYPHCLSGLSCELSTRWKHPREGSLSRAISFSKGIALKKQRICYILVEIVVVVIAVAGLILASPIIDWLSKKYANVTSCKYANVHQQHLIG